MLAHIVGDEGFVHGVELEPGLVEYGSNNIKHLGNASIVRAGEELGLRREAPYDRILVSAAADQLPQALVDQLRPGGKMVIPIRSSVWLIEKDSQGVVHKHEHYGFAFVPLR